MWIRLAEIHKDRASRVHGTELFLPWHRAYLNYFEQIARQLPGCSDFTIPYWDWTTPSRIPLIFGEDPNKPWDDDLDGIEPPCSWNLPPNFSWKRAPLPNAKVGKLMEDIGTTDIYALIGRDNFGCYAGHLESGSHAIIHTQVIKGNMGDPMTAALDPIFWVHHANIDRLWSKWMEKNLKITPSPICPIEGCENCKNPPIIKNWLRNPLNVESNSSNLKVYDLIDNRNLDYIYENTPEIMIWNDCTQVRDFRPDNSVKSDFNKAKTANVNSFVTVSVKEAFIKPENLTNLKNIQAAIFEFLKIKLANTDLSTAPSLLLTIEVEKPENPEISVMVFINVSKDVDPSKLTVDSPLYAATFSFFESIEVSHHHDSGSKEEVGSRHFIFDITNTILNLKSFDMEATLSICPKLLQEKPDSDMEKINLLGFGFSLSQYQTDKIK
jgi:hypothetical protein